MRRLGPYLEEFTRTIAAAPGPSRGTDKSARRHGLPGRIALRHTRIIAGGVGAVIPILRGIRLVAIIGIAVTGVGIVIIPGIGQIEPAEPDRYAAAVEPTAKSVAVKPSVEITGVESVPVKSVTTGVSATAAVYVWSAARTAQ